MCDIKLIYLQIDAVKYDADQEVTNNYENLQIVQSQFFITKQICIYVVYETEERFKSSGWKT